jgi:hypothetical protein
MLCRILRFALGSRVACLTLSISTDFFADLLADAFATSA